MKPLRFTRNTAGLNRGWRGRRDRREGARQRAIRRAFLGYGAVLSTRELLEIAWPRLDTTKLVPEWQWREVRRAARRYAEPVLNKRTRPLLWRARG